MPREYTALLNEPPPLAECPNCGACPFEPFLRGLVQRAKRWLFIGPRRPYVAVICADCKEIVGHESPPEVTT